MNAIIGVIHTNENCQEDKKCPSFIGKARYEVKRQPKRNDFHGKLQGAVIYQPLVIPDGVSEQREAQFEKRTYKR